MTIHRERFADRALSVPERVASKNSAGARSLDADPRCGTYSTDTITPSQDGSHCLGEKRNSIRQTSRIDQAIWDSITGDRASPGADAAHRSPELRIGSLFTGIGGIELGFHRAGFRTVWVIERDEYARGVLRERFPDAQILCDVASIDFSRLPRVDVITGGFPCQDISIAGGGFGIAGVRSGLWRYCVDAVRDCRPRVALFENVSALTRRGLDRVLCDLASVGYDAEWHCVPAASVGAPHRRDRIFILAYPDGSGHVHGETGEFPAEAWRSTVGDAITGSLSLADGHTVLYGSDAGVGWWAAEPGVGRVAHGVPHWMDRIRCLGNAVVPALAQAIGETIRDSLLADRAPRVTTITVSDDHNHRSNHDGKQ